MTHQYIKLPFNFGDYEPVISTEIMQLHYEKHYKGYVDNLNKALGKYPQFFDVSIPSLLSNISDLPDDIRTTCINNAGGLLNHEMFFKTLNPHKPQPISGNLKAALVNSFGSVENFKEWMITTAKTHFGSGWAWLVLTKNKELKIYSLTNQDSPYLKGDIPIFGIDVWEHAYYLQYKNVRAAYIDAVWEIIDWSVVEEYFNAAWVA